MKRYSTEEIYPKSQMGKCMVYFNMSHHYRRIYSAKPRVDTNLSKKSQPQFCCSSTDVFNFVKRNCMRRPIIITPRHRVCIKDEESQKPFKPKILDHRAESKLRSLPVYQPPQKIVLPKTNQTEKPTENTNKPEAEQKDVEENNNECNKSNKNHLSEIKEESTKETSRIEKFESETTNKSEVNGDEGSKFRPLNKSTVMFLKDITDDILRKGIYTNKSLEKLFSHHIQKNKYSLPQDLMEKEVARLKMELEMPLEDERTTTDSSVEDEEVLTALDSLLLPADIRDQVASSLGLKRKPPPLPSPKDSFTGSLALTSMSEGHEKPLNDHTGTFTIKTSEFKDAQDDNGKIGMEVPKSAVHKIPEDNKNTLSDNDETIADEEYPEEVNSVHTSIAHEVASDESTNAQETKSEEQISDRDIVSEKKSHSTGSKSEEPSKVSADNSEVESSVSEVKSEINNEESIQGEESDKEGEGETSESQSIHTEQEE